MSFDEKHTDEKDTAEKSQTATTDSINSETDRVDALENLEILPQILQEGILFAGSGSALLLQAAMPEIRNEHDKTSDGPNLATELGDALQAMLSYFSCLVFGTRQEKKTLLDMLGRGQPPLPGSEHYYAAAPKVQLWVAATLYAIATDFYQRIYGRVDYRTAERAYAEFGLLIHSLGLPPGIWPQTRQDFWTYWDDRIERLTVTPDANKFAKDLLHDKAVPRWVSMLKPFLRVLTIEMLPPRLREEYGLKSTMGTRGLYRSTMGFSNAVYPALPVSMRSYPLRYYFQELRKHMKTV
ncbi:oxygenase MpaB family protein [Aspergillus clavatus NRRL 1]|uniref:ER-bound oxygenase mpaB/mpaB'/Rubber oxygenase catalytic domain-containing protein n=1 Tax=Aspergillus clavatus (strain ATCC 1007 / CBS 513.65 / DSM 816 / NCTC 3887 / NRRL 1 / QM 1276 / 107) TaxID=344612 RepID=A1CL77_ASPCL|nr:uncharacterized protein ACLA_041170 [Aspergillus clavatus NRRL 1]EAW09901.1 conserved hypothetical protein [Aspergillus clavatus NRRL 1]